MKKKICFVTSCLRGGGAERVVSIIASYLADSNDYCVRIVTYNDYEVVYKTSPAVEVVTLKSNNKVKKILELRKALADAECIISFDYSICIRTYLSTLFQRKIHIMSERNDPRRNVRRNVVKVVRRIVYSRAKAVVFQTAKAKNYFSTSIGKKGFIIPNPVDYNKMPVQSELGMKSKRFIAVGRIEPQKNFPLLIKSFKAFLEMNPNYRLDIFGEGNEKRNIQKIIDDYHLGGNISIHAYSKNIFSELSNSAVYISTSNFEGISNAMLEAICIGIPVVVTDCNNGGVRDYVIDGKNGYVVPVNDQKAIVDSMINLISNETLLKNCISFNMEQRKMISIDSIGEMWKKLIAQSLIT